jgi:hypothetical protein
MCQPELANLLSPLLLSNAWSDDWTLADIFVTNRLSASATFDSRLTHLKIVA